MAGDQYEQPYILSVEMVPGKRADPGLWLLGGDGSCTTCRAGGGATGSTSGAQVNRRLDERLSRVTTDILPTVLS